MQFDRTNTSALGRWWWTIDRLNLAALFALCCLGALMVFAASPPVAERIGLPALHFVSRQHMFLALAIGAMLLVSMLSVNNVRRLGVLMFLGSLAMLILLPFLGLENKGATRWLQLPGLTIQPSEFVKPGFAVLVAWMFAEKYKTMGFPGFRIAMATYLLVATLLIIQPDFGMTVTVSFMFGLQFFLAGMPFIWVVMMGLMGIGGAVAAYHALPHVQRRIDQFLDPTSGDNYQVEKSLEAFREGGILGRGPGEGVVKQHIPDSHTDFVFAVAGEEFGALLCLLIIGLFAFVVLRGFWRIWRESDLFVVLAVAGLLAQFGVQAMINMGVAVNLLPAKGMTLPFLSYGGSSLIAIGIGMGMMLALTRKRFGAQPPDLRGRVQVKR